jgi:ech hydrogenase subunit D
VSSGLEQSFEIIPIGALLDRVGALRQAGYRLMQISATRLPEHLELTYSFDRDRQLANLRYWCAFLYENEMHDLFNLQVDGMAVDFHGHLYETAVKFPFGSTQAPGARPAPSAAPPAKAAATNAPVQVVGQASRLPIGPDNAGGMAGAAGETPAPLPDHTAAQPAAPAVKT